MELVYVLFRIEKYENPKSNLFTNTVRIIVVRTRTSHCSLVCCCRYGFSEVLLNFAVTLTVELTAFGIKMSLMNFRNFFWILHCL